MRRASASSAAVCAPDSRTRVFAYRAGCPGSAGRSIPSGVGAVTRSLEIATGHYGPGQTAGSARIAIYSRPSVYDSGDHGHHVQGRGGIQRHAGNIADTRYAAGGDHELIAHREAGAGNGKRGRGKR